MGHESSRAGMEHAVILREVVDTDLPVFYKHQADPVACKMAAFPSRPLDAFMEHWKRIRADPDIVLRTILYQGQVAGTVMSFMLGGKRQVGYWIGREFWGKGIATQALAQFLQQVKTRPLHAHVARHNAASLRVLEKCGFSITGQEPGSMTWKKLPVEDYVLTLEG
jgi:RimJ/RimL family protein N-acetyltransferase